jgi:Dyp-type peroxidase family
MAKIPLHKLDRPLSPADLHTYRRELRLLQANILKSHGREATASVFLTFKRGRVASARRFVRSFADKVTSAHQQEVQARRYQATRATELLTTFHLSAAGYKYLGRDSVAFCPGFGEGLRGSITRLGDPPCSAWEPQFQKPLHVMVLLAHDHASALSFEVGRLREEVSDFALSSVEWGLTMRNGDNWPIEHFGYVDGLSQPLFFLKDVRDARPYRPWDPSAGPSLVLVRDPHARSSGECGSYVVFRKLEQNVKAFKLWEKKLAHRLGLHGPQALLAGAMLVGRFTDGTPLALHPAPNGKRENDFVFETSDPPRVAKCPVFAHVRKANPRGTSGDSQERDSRIARRGVTYGSPTPPGEDESTWPERGVGLLFQCCQRSLRDQFERIQSEWINDPIFPHAVTGQDIVTGQSDQMRLEVPVRWHSSRTVSFEFRKFVTMLGGEYFFAPSIASMRRIGRP